jgi:hypothetical protein
MDEKFGAKAIINSILSLCVAFLPFMLWGFWATTGSDSVSSALQSMLSFTLASAVFYIMIAVPIVLLYGLPVHYLINKFELSHWYAYPLASVLPGLFVILYSESDFGYTLIGFGAVYTLAFYCFSFKIGSNQNRQGDAKHIARLL